MKIQHGLFLGFITLGLQVSGEKPAFAVGEAVNGFPNWEERVIQQWMNRARSEPQVEMTACSTMYGASRCGEAACFSAIAPLVYSQNLNHAARFHSDEMRNQGYFAHDSNCAVPSNINQLYPTSCQGAASCACVSGTATAWNARVGLFGTNPSGEIIASGMDPNGAFYQWLFESSSSTTCAYSTANGHRWNILKSTGSVGTGVSGPSVGDFAGGSVMIPKIPSGSHYPRQSASVEMWANWYDTAAPMSASVDIDGTCQPLTKKRGSDMNGAWSATVTTAGSGCHRYFFLFQDSGGQTVLYPTTGSLAIGPASGCPDYDTSRPAAGTGCAVQLSAEPPPGTDPGPGPGPGPGTDPGTDPGGGGMATGCNFGGGVAGGLGAALPLLLSLVGIRRLRRRRG